MNKNELNFTTNQISNTTAFDRIININFEQLLTKTLSIIKVERENSENLINRLSDEYYAEFLLRLSEILSDENYSDQNRHQAAIILKNKIIYETYICKWNSIEESARNNIKMRILSTLATKSSIVRRAVSNIVACIFRIEASNNYWVDLIETLNRIAMSQGSQWHIVESAIETLSFICEELYIQGTNFCNVLNKKQTDLILNCIFSNINLNIDQRNRRVEICLNCLLNTIPLANENFSDPDERKYIMESLFLLSQNYFCKNTNSDNKEQREIIKNLIIKLLILICDKYYDLMNEFIGEIVNFTTSLIENFKRNSIEISEKSILLTLEIWCNLGDKELDQSDIFDDEKKKKDYFKSYASFLFQYLVDFLTYSNENVLDKDADFNGNWSISKASAYILCLIVRLSNSTFLEKLLVYSEENYNSVEELKRYSSLIALSCCIDTLHKDKITNLLQFNLENFISRISDKSNLVSTTCSWLLCKITEHFPYLFKKSMLCLYLPLFMIIIHEGTDNNFFDKNPDTNNEEDDGLTKIEEVEKPNKFYSKKIRINLCIVLISIIQYYGDKFCLKEQNTVSSYYLKILEAMLFTAFDKENYSDKCNNLSFYSFQVMTTVIDYSSLDFQEVIENVLAKFLEYLSNLNSEIAKETNLRYKGCLYEVQQNHCQVIDRIIIKITRKVRIDLCSKLIDIINESFKLRNNVYESGISCLSNLVLNLKEEFFPYLDTLMQYFIFALNNYNTCNLLCKTAIISISNIVGSIGDQFYSYADNIIPILFIIMMDNDINRTSKLQAIPALGDICMNSPSSFKKYFTKIMEILLSACEIAAQKSTKNMDDEEFDEFLVKLRIVLIETFTSITFGVQEINYTVNYTTYLHHILNYLKLFSNLSKLNSELILNSFALLADIVSIYPKNVITPLIDKEFVSQNLKELQNREMKQNSATKFLWAKNVIISVLDLE